MNAHVTWHEDPAEIARLGDYCATDVLSECAVDAAVPPLSERERRIWILNQKLNDRGVLIDLPLAAKAQALVEFAKKRADERMFQLTNGYVSTCGQVAKIIEWLGARGILCKSIADGETEELIASAELFSDDTAIEVLNVRRGASKAFKFKAMLDAACSDGRVRGCIAYHGAHTGRDAGRIIQPQNMKRLDDDRGDHDRVAQALELMRRIHPIPELYEALEFLLGDVLEVLSVCARAMLIADKGRRFIGGDFSNIEGRLAAWFAGASWKLNAFRAYDTVRPYGSRAGPDLYKVTAGRVLGKPIEAITKQERQVSGKVTELACGYQGMLNALKKMAAKAGLRIADEVLLNAGRGWREANPEIVAAWRELEDAVVDAVANPGVIVSAFGGRVQYVVHGDFLFCRLPSTRVISYAQPRCTWTSKVITTADGDEVEINKRVVSYWGSHQGRFMKQDLYGGAEFNHVVQGFARDVLYDAALEIDEAGYPLLLPVHDEALTEPLNGFGSVEDFTARMARPRPCFDGLPLAVAAWEGPRYDK